MQKKKAHLSKFVVWYKNEISQTQRGGGGGTSSIQPSGQLPYLWSTQLFSLLFGFLIKNVDSFTTPQDKMHELTLAIDITDFV